MVEVLCEFLDDAFGGDSRMRTRHYNQHSVEIELAVDQTTYRKWRQVAMAQLSGKTPWASLL